MLGLDYLTNQGLNSLLNLGMKTYHMQMKENALRSFEQYGDKSFVNTAFYNTDARQETRKIISLLMCDWEYRICPHVCLLSDQVSCDQVSCDQVTCDQV